MKKLALLAAVAGVAFTAPAFAQTMAPAPADNTAPAAAATGNPKADAAASGAGTYSAQSSEKLKVSKDGATKDVTKEKTVSDPKGLGNKVKHKKKHVKKTDKNGNVTKDKTTVDGHTTDNLKTGTTTNQ